MKHLVVLALLLVLVLPVTAQITSTAALFDAMRAHHANRPSTLTFVQTTIQHRPDGRADTTTWYEAAVPGKLRIDFAPIEDGNGVLFRDGKRYVFQNGALVNEAPDVNPLQVLLMDIFSRPTDETALVLDTLGYDLELFREGTWDDLSVYVVGAAAEDSTSAQFWVDPENLVVVRIIQPVGPEKQFTLDAQVTGHEVVDGVWHENEIMIYVDSHLVQEEYYDQIRLGAPLDDALFDRAAWRLDKPYWK